MSAFSISPAVTVREVDLTGIVPAVSTTVGAIAGAFQWGPVEDPQLISNEGELVSRFGRPNGDNFETFFTAANFLSYSNALYVSRAASSDAYNATTGTTSNIQIKNRDDYELKASSFGSGMIYFAKWPGEVGNSLRISVCDSQDAFNSTIQYDPLETILAVNFTINSNVVDIVIEDAGANTAEALLVAADVESSLRVGDFILAGNSSIGTQYLKITEIESAITEDDNAVIRLKTENRYSLSSDFTTSVIDRSWEFFNLVNSAPGTTPYAQSQDGEGDELHIVIIDEDGKFTGNQGTVLEVWQNLSRATDAVGEQGGSIYYVNVINQSSRYVWFGNHRPGYSVGLASTIEPIQTLPYNENFATGTSGPGENTLTLSSLASAYNKFMHGEEIDISLLLTGKSRFGENGEGLANYLIDNIAESRKDCVVFLSPSRETVVQNPGNEATDLVRFRRNVRASSYAFMDSGYKYQYDRYNDTFRWIPLNGDIAGTVVRTDDTRDPWFSPAGFNRGQIKNLVKLAFNPDKAARDLIYKNDVNPVVSFPNLGTVLFGDKTLLGKPSAFDRINVRRLFIVLQKAIATASKFILFEFNDEFTRAQFRNLVEPYLRDIQGRRGIFDFRVDTSRNTPEVIDRNEFIGDIFIKPARSINFIQLNFVAVRTGVEFQEIVGGPL